LTAKNKNVWLMANVLTESFVYKATVKSVNYTKFYVCITGLRFKDRYTKHKYSFKHEKHATTLSQYIWKLEIIKLNLTFIGKY